MVWFKRIFLFMAVNVLVVLTLSVILNVLGVRPYLSAYGLNYASLAIFCLVWGMGGAFVSLLLSRWMIKMAMGVQVIDPNTNNPRLAQLVSTVHRLARDAGIETMPEVGIYTSPEPNAFATGPSRNRSLVAVSTGLLENMNSSAVEGVLGHEVAHVANGDMVTMTLLQGVVNAFVMFFARILAFAIENALRSNDRDSRGSGGMLRYLLVPVLEMLLMPLGFMVVAAFSRWREFRADAGGARLAGREKMVSALQSLQSLMATRGNYAQQQTQNEPATVAALKISSSKASGLRHLFSTHPPMEERIRRLQLSQY